MKPFIVLVFSFFSLQLNAQLPFSDVYEEVPQIPRGILEAVSWNQTHMKHLTAAEHESCLGMPRTYGLMGLTLNGKNYFRENLKTVSKLSGITQSEILNDPHKNVLAWAKSFKSVLNELSSPVLNHDKTYNWNTVVFALKYLSEIPDTGYVNAYAMDAQMYSILSFLNDEQKATQYSFPVYHIDLAAIFGNERYAVLSAPKIVFSSEGIKGNGVVFPKPLTQRSTQYGPAIWDAAPSCNYSSRAGTPVSAVTIHTIQGTYAGAISWAKNCDSEVSYHYVVRSSDGQITQMVDESIKAWHVGSENPYTIGYEHEGYISDPSWYTTAMYNASAALTRDVCVSGYGINPLRTYAGASSSSTVTLGSCIKIKGHQHYPYQTHTDPGIYWNWPLYYSLVNNSTVPTTYVATTGTFYDSGGPSGNYADDERKLYLIQPTGATTVSLTFTAFDLELNWDYIYIYDGNSTASPLIGSWTGTSSPGTITSTGGSLLVEFRSDCNTTNPGWACSYTAGTATPPTADVTSPTTAISVPSTWVSSNFVTTFTDADETGGSGLEKSFYQVLENNGTEWRCNSSRGYFNDEFNGTAIHPDWSTVTGTWNITSGTLTQTDESLSNTNIYAYLGHSYSNRYLYHWSGKIEGTGTNRRAGFHYFCDSPTLTNRGNSYFVWFRLDDDKIEIYKVISDVFYLQTSVTYNFNAAQWYDFKLQYDRITGETYVYVDNVRSLTWTDSSTPWTGGNYISFRSGNAKWTVDNLKVYRSRAATATILVGPVGDLEYENIDPTTPAGRIRSIVNDFAGNMSTVASVDINVDYSEPTMVPFVMDITPADEDSSTSTYNATAYWGTATDPNSGIARYYYELRTTYGGGSTIIPSTDNGWYDSVTVTGLSLEVGKTYYFEVIAENAAGLSSYNWTKSDSFKIVLPTAPPVANFYAMSTIVCQGQCIEFTNTSSDATTFNWTFTGGDISTSSLANPVVCYTASGTYDATLIASGPGGTDTIYQTINVTVYEPPTAGFTMTDDTAYMPSPFVGFTNTSANANGYSWDFGDGQISSGSDPWNLYPAPGTYTVTMIAVNGPCANDTTYATVVVIDPNGIGEVSGGINISMYPNPVNNHLFVSVNGQLQNAQVTVLNNIGQVVLNEPVSGSKALAVNGLSKGIYMLSIKTPEHILFKANFVKE